MLRTIMEIRAHPILLPAMPRRAIGVISSRMRWKDHFTISSLSLADLGGQNDRGAYIAFLLAVISSLIWPAAIPSHQVTRLGIQA
jgi:hypothetical protein